MTHIRSSSAAVAIADVGLLRRVARAILIASAVCTATPSVWILAEDASPKLEQEWSELIDNGRDLETWSATATIEDRSVDATGENVSRHHVEFVLDCTTRRCRWSWQSEPVARRSPHESPQPPLHVACMVKDHAYYRLAMTGQPSGTAERLGRRVIRVTDVDDAIDPFAIGQLDPVLWLTGGGCRLHDLRWPDDRPSGAQRPLPREVSLPPDASTAGDPQAGLRELRSVRRDPAGSTRWVSQCEQHRGAWIPRRIELQAVDVAGVVQRQRTIRFENCVVNAGVSRDAWSLEQLGAHSGDLVHDERFGARYVHVGNRPAEPAAESNAMADDPTIRVLAMTIGIWIVILGSIAATSRGKGSLSRQANEAV